MSLPRLITAQALTGWTAPPAKSGPTPSAGVSSSEIRQTRPLFLNSALTLRLSSRKELPMLDNRKTSEKTHDPDLNHLMWGKTYRAITATGHATGEYIGVETTHGVWSILLRHKHRTESIPFSRIESITAA